MPSVFSSPTHLYLKFFWVLHYPNHMQAEARPLICFDMAVSALQQRLRRGCNRHHDPCIAQSSNIIGKTFMLSILFNTQLKNDDLEVRHESTKSADYPKRAKQETETIYELL